MIIFICVSTYLAIGFASDIVFVKLSPDSFDFENDTTFSDKIGIGLLIFMGLLWPLTWIILVAFVGVELLKNLFIEIKNTK